MIKKHLSISLKISSGFLSLILLFSNTIVAETDAVESVEVIVRQDNNLFSKALEQLSNIDFTFEKLGQALNSGKVKPKDKAAAKNYIKSTRLLIDRVLRGSVFELSPANYTKVTYFNKVLIDNLSKAVNSNFSKVMFINEGLLVDQLNSIYLVLEESLQGEGQELLLKNENDLNILCGQFKFIGLNRFNIFMRDLEKFAKKNVITKNVRSKTKRALPYLGAVSYLLLINKKDQFDSIPYVGSFFGKTKEKFHQYLQEHDKEKHNAKDHKFNLIDNLLHLKAEPIFTISIAGLMLPVLKQDAKDLSKWSNERFEDTMALLKGESVKDRASVKKSKLDFDKVAGYSSIKSKLNNVVNYFRNRDLFDLTGTAVPASYLLSGQLDTSAELAQALAGELTKVVSAKDKNKFCGVFNIHVSELVNKSVKDDIISKIEDEDCEYCIIILNELDWLYEHAINKSKIWSKVNELFRTVKSKKSKMSIFTTMKDVTLLDSISDSLFEVILNVNKPNLSDIKDILKKELKNRAINASNFDLDVLAQKAKNLSISNLRYILNQAFSNAYLNNQTLTQQTLEKALEDYLVA